MIDWEKIVVKNNGDGKMFFWCSGCGCAHILQTEKHGQHGNHIFNDDLYKPTFKLESGLPFSMVNSAKDHCAFTITDGIITYRPECTHHLAGHSTEMRERWDWGGIIFTENDEGTFNYKIEK